VSEEEETRQGWGEVLDFYGHTEGAVMAFARERLACLSHTDSDIAPSNDTALPREKDEVVELVKSGPPSNRIDLVFMVPPPTIKIFESYLIY
jgi:hypothetical protein